MTKVSWTLVAYKAATTIYLLWFVSGDRLLNVSGKRTHSRVYTRPDSTSRIATFSSREPSMCFRNDNRYLLLCTFQHNDARVCAAELLAKLCQR